MDIGVYVFYNLIFVDIYIYIYIYILFALCALVHTYIYFQIHSVLMRDSLVLRLHFVFWSLAQFGNGTIWDFQLASLFQDHFFPLKTLEISVKTKLSKSTIDYTCTSWDNQQQEYFCYSTLTQTVVMVLLVHHTFPTSNVKLPYW